jgi:hypothetical protein
VLRALELPHRNAATIGLDKYTVSPLTHSDRVQHLLNPRCPPLGKVGDGIPPDLVCAPLYQRAVHLMAVLLLQLLRRPPEAHLDGKGRHGTVKPCARHT